MIKLILFSILSLNITHSYSQEFVLQNKNTRTMLDFCDKVDSYFSKYKWGNSACKTYDFKHELVSVKKDPLIYTTYGDTESENRYLIMCGVHGDEITPIKFCFDILENINEEIKDSLIVIAPIVNPDSFLKKKPTRTNENGVDVNRNFPTKNWNKFALKKWKRRYRSDKRRYPGHECNSEPETKFQVSLINKFKPNYIISVHAPLTLIDYDGPVYNHNGEIHSAKKFLKEMAKKANHYRIKDYPVFPGSLGNYSGYERKIPTLTIELPSSDPSKHGEYWNRFKKAFSFALKN